VLLSSLIRTAAITGRADSIDTPRVNALLGGRQGGRWARQTVAAALPKETPPGAEHSRAQTLAELTKLHERGVVTDAEFEALRAQLAR
jgi:hypothetical protein